MRSGGHVLARDIGDQIVERLAGALVDADLEEMLQLLGSIDINLAPLEMNNPYCDSKSQLKIFEAAELCSFEGYRMASVVS